MKVSRTAAILLSTVIAGLMCGCMVPGPGASGEAKVTAQQDPLEEPRSAIRAGKERLGMDAGSGELRMDLGTYGFRYDPMAWAMSSDNLAAAWVRTRVLEKPKSGDPGIIEKEIQRAFSQQQPDGYLGEESHGVLWRLLDLGCAADRPEFRNALKAMYERQGLEGYNLNVACRAGWENADELKQAVAEMKAQWDESADFWGACPWHGQNFMQILWAGREHQDVAETVERNLIVMRGHLQNGRHWPIYKDPFGWLECAGYIDHPVSKEIVIKMIPMILRSQEADGSWGGEDHLGYGPGNHTFVVFRALHKWGLLEPLRSKPPLPPEWKIARTIPTPSGELHTMTWDGSRLWVYDKTTGKAIAVSPEDGKVLRSVNLPEDIGGIAWSKGSLLATQLPRKVVLYVDPDTGAVQREIASEDDWCDFSAMAELDGSIWIADNFLGGVHRLVDGRIDPGVQWLAGGGAVDMAASDGHIWHIDAFNHLLILNDLDRPMALRDWAGVPFGHGTRGLAWDGKHLWALDAANRRICMIERSESGKRASEENIARALAREKRAVEGGSAKDGRFVRVSSPAFSLEYPQDLAVSPTAEWPSATTVLSATHTSGLPTYTVDIFEMDPSGDAAKALQAQVSRSTIPHLKIIGSDVAMVSNEPTGKYVGCKAFVSEITWRTTVPLTTLVLRIAKEGKMIQVSGTVLGEATGPVMALLDSIRLDPS